MVEVLLIARPPIVASLIVDNGKHFGQQEVTELLPRDRSDVSAAVRGKYA